MDSVDSDFDSQVQQLFANGTTEAPILTNATGICSDENHVECFALIVGTRWAANVPIVEMHHAQMFFSVLGSSFSSWLWYVEPTAIPRTGYRSEPTDITGETDWTPYPQGKVSERHGSYLQTVRIC